MKRYGHNLSHTETSTVNMGVCIPGNIIEVFPGDSFKITAKDLTRFLPQVAPTMHDVLLELIHIKFRYVRFLKNCILTGMHI